MQTQTADTPVTIDFDLATDFLIKARMAHERGDMNNFQALRHLVILTLGLSSDAVSGR